MSSDLAKLFQSIGLSPQKALETVSNKKLSTSLESVIRKAGAGPQIDKTVGALLYNLASTSTPKTHTYFENIGAGIVDGRLATSDQVSAAIKYCDSLKTQFDVTAFNLACGVGVVVTMIEIENAVTELLRLREDELHKKRYQITGSLLGALKNEIKWANPLLIKTELGRQLGLLLGDKDERDDLKAQKKKEKEAKGLDAAKDSSLTFVPAEGDIVDRARSSKFIFEGELARMHKAGENPQINEENIKLHLKRTGGKVITRFPPEPNGHAKAININFGFASAHGGITNLRYDDTNPEAEEEAYFTAIKDTVEWLGYKPDAITYSSDNFQRLFDLAVDLIKRDKAYICHSTGPEIHDQRGGDSKSARFHSPWRNRPIIESLKEFERMRLGEYKEGEATLRMKMDMDNPNPQFWDLIAYRVMYISHIRTGKDWVIYPSYDYCHAICDSFEDITHSFCTTEFTMSRESYYWLVDALEIYRPVQWESGRLNIGHTVLSKRKLNKLVTDGLVQGWDDPRLHTLASLKRRGFTPESINAFARELGVTTANSTVSPERLDNYVREHLNQVAPRLFMLLEPLKLTITNIPLEFSLPVVLQNQANDVSKGNRTLLFTKTVYIDSCDFREEPDSNFYRLSPGKIVGLLQVPFPIKATKVIKKDGIVVEVEAEYMVDSTLRPKTYIQWIGSTSFSLCEARLVSKLFVHANPDNKEDVPGGWLSDFNPDSLKIVKGCMVDSGIHDFKIGGTFQAVRIGYFCIDIDSDLDSNRIILNRTVTLKEDSKKNK